MKRVTTLSDLRAARSELPGPLGFVPTMGCLHEGHLSLVRMARDDCSSVVASIFVNPSQFGPKEDLEHYPRDPDRDCALLQKEGVDLVWLPSTEIVYPRGYQTWVTVDHVARPLEGACRPGHFRGVATVVCKLFNAVQPDRAYFGQKDAQQVLVIQQMTRDLNLPSQIAVGPTVRESDGLATSSRNSYLDPEERRAATVLYRSLSEAKRCFREGQRDAESLRKTMRAVLESEPRARAEYVSCANPGSLDELEGPVREALLSMAVFVGETRLIDNMLISEEQ